MKAVLVTAALFSLAVAQTAFADADCRKVHSSLNIIPVLGPDCPSPVGICDEGTFKGGVKGDYSSVLLTFNAATGGQGIYQGQICVP